MARLHSRVVSTIIVVFCATLLGSSPLEAAEITTPSISEVTRRLASGTNHVRIACFGDSITGVYYHTGSQRAWCDMLGIALRGAYPKAKVEMINAGIGGHTTVDALGRIDQDVIAIKPDLVVVMFGMNDVTRVDPEAFQANLDEIAERCLAAGAAVVLCTPNSVYENPSRTNARLKDLAHRVKRVAIARNLPVVDCFKAWQDIRRQDETEWMLMMSDTIHPNMNGHKRFAELIASTIGGKDISLGHVEPPDDALHTTFDRLHLGQPVTLIAMPPYDKLVPEVLREHFPDARFQVTSWPVESNSVVSLSEWAKRIRDLSPHLVVVAVPAAATEQTTEAYIRNYEWVLNWSFQFGRRAWDVLPILPTVTAPVGEDQRERLTWARRIVIGKDVQFVDQQADEPRSTREILTQWVSDRKKRWEAASHEEPISQTRGDENQERTASGIHFSEHLIADDYSYPYGIAAADLDGDGDLDLTSADCKTNDSLYWFENDGTGQFARHIVQNKEPARLERHAVGDIDGNGYPDIVIVKNLKGHLLWFENSGRPREGNPWRRHVITTKLPGAYDVTLANFDGDGDLDVAASSWLLGNQFAWYENDGTPDDGAWTKHLIEDELDETRTIRAADFDGDGDIDLLGTAAGNPRDTDADGQLDIVPGVVLWYENTCHAGAIHWKRHEIDRSPRPMHGEPADIDGDGDLDVVLALGMSAPTDTAHTHQVLWYENNGAPAAGTWPKHVIAARFPDGIEAVAGDLDGDGDTDVVASSWRAPGRIAWFENSGDPQSQWTMHVLKDNWRSANQVIIADLNGDGRRDIAAVAEHGSYEFRWWRNEGTRKLDGEDQP